MQRADFQRFRDLMRGMGRVFNAEPDALVLDVYWLALRDWDLAQFEAAAARLMATAKFMPRPADFNELKNAGNDTPAEAWETALANCTSWRDGDSTAGPLIDRVVRMIGGYHAIAMANVQEALPHLQRRFMQIYSELAQVESVREALPQIAMKTPGSGAFRSIGDSTLSIERTNEATP